MIWAALACLIACGAVSVVAPRLGRLTHPALATRLLAVVAGSTALVILWVLALTAGTLLAQIPVVAGVGEWSPELIAASDPWPRWVAIGCLALAVRALIVGARTATAQLAGIVTLRRAMVGVRPAGALVVLDDPRGVAFATPANGGRVVVSTGMLRALRPDERRALLAHESSHVRHRHYWWVAAAELSAAMFPILRATARAVAGSAERWADEDAAEDVGDRSTVAHALARAALHASAAPVPHGAVAATKGSVVTRVEALLGPPPGRRWSPAWALVALVAVSLLAAWLVAQNTDALFDGAAVESQAATVDAPAL
jgi:Zn-dependent protease with chaperone function